MQGHECTFIYMHIDLLSNPIIFFFFPLMHGRLFNIIYPTSKCPLTFRLTQLFVYRVGGRVGGWWLLFWLCFSLRNYFWPHGNSKEPLSAPTPGGYRQTMAGFVGVPRRRAATLNASNRDGNGPTNTGQLFQERQWHGGRLFARA